MKSKQPTNYMLRQKRTLKLYVHLQANIGRQTNIGITKNSEVKKQELKKYN
ncbi:MAG: hypothetical protein BroJett025_07580 [Patescibacteria group bacterium]|nr:MAG: hypothetical protein BroJett025_07580 [Patescibacteria group bacterium]